MDAQRRDETDERREYEPPELTVLASVEEATLMATEMPGSGDAVNFS
jgi:hypothetical protein